LLYILIDEVLYVSDRTERVRLLEAGADVSVRVRCRWDVERTRRRVCLYRRYDRQSRVAENRSVMGEVKKYVRRHSV
jgi:hypothetical protein